MLAETKTMKVILDMSNERAPSSEKLMLRRLYQALLVFVVRNATQCQAKQNLFYFQILFL